MTDRQVKGLGWAALTTIISGIAVFSNGLVVTGIDPVVHTTVKNGMVGVAIVGILLANRGLKELQGLSLKDGLRLLAISIIGGSIPFLLFFSGLKMVGGAQGAMIHKTLILWVALMAVPFLKEKVSKKMAAGILLLYGSNFLLGFKGFGELQLGHLMVLIATMLWAVENIVAKVTLKNVSANLLVAARMGLGSVWLLAYAILTGKGAAMATLSGEQWLMLSGVALLLFGYVRSWYRALQLAPVTLVAGMLVGASVITNVLKLIFTDTAIGLPLVGQAIVIATGIWLVVMAVMDLWKTRSEQVSQA